MKTMNNTDMDRCIQECLDCHAVCLREAMQHCLELGGKHTEPEHFRLMVACAEICQTAANVLLAGVELHPRVCEVCAEVCEACARSCERVGQMEKCVEACTRCADACRRMAHQAA
ncbi:MAG: four-helix bundle copper-binding protein [bacterium]